MGVNVNTTSINLKKSGSLGGSVGGSRGVEGEGRRNIKDYKGLSNSKTSVSSCKVFSLTFLNKMIE